MSASIIDTLHLFWSSSSHWNTFHMTEMDSVPLVIMTWVDTQFVCE